MVKTYLPQSHMYYCSFVFLKMKTWLFRFFDSPRYVIGQCTFLHFKMLVRYCCHQLELLNDEMLMELTLASGINCLRCLDNCIEIIMKRLAKQTKTLLLKLHRNYNETQLVKQTKLYCYKLQFLTFFTCSIMDGVAINL